ncbi:hypothetical protein DFJ73DRAFT_804140 [Zopfochytrium polystomum]|nr:hypothetical protein DFJ73DRAFT_804140 [Zopfochytrium polystomum]
MAALDPTNLTYTNLVAAGLALKYFLTLNIQGGKRFPAGTRPPEDKTLSLDKALGRGAVQSFGLEPAESKALKAARAEDTRWQRIVNNDVENIPIGLIVSYASLLAPNGSSTVHRIGVVGFFLARTLHTVAYAGSLQPHRAIAWLLGWACVLALGGNAALGSL